MALLTFVGAEPSFHAMSLLRIACSCNTKIMFRWLGISERTVQCDKKKLQTNHAYSTSFRPIQLWWKWAPTQKRSCSDPTSFDITFLESPKKLTLNFVLWFSVVNYNLTNVSFFISITIIVIWSDVFFGTVENLITAAITPISYFLTPISYFLTHWLLCLWRTV